MVPDADENVRRRGMLRDRRGVNQAAETVVLMVM